MALAATIVWLTREHLLPKPRVTGEALPHYRSTPPPPQAEPDDLTVIKGIGPAFSERLGAAGIVSYRALAESDAASVAEQIDTSEAAVADWIAQAQALLS